jgi:hypothetical protein
LSDFVEGLGTPVEMTLGGIDPNDVVASEAVGDSESELNDGGSLDAAMEGANGIDDGTSLLAVLGLAGDGGDVGSVSHVLTKDSQIMVPDSSIV